MIAGLTEPSSGYITIQGNSKDFKPLNSNTLLSFCPSSVEVNDFMTVKEVLLYFSLLHSNLKVSEAKERVES